MLATILSSVLFATTPKASADSVTPVLKRQVRALLSDYARKDGRGILNMLDDGPVVFMGTGLSEVAPSRPKIERFLASDFSLWDTSRFGEYDSFFVRASGDMASVLLDVPWVATTDGKSSTFTIRLATVWHRTPDGWKLMQLLNEVPTGR